MLRKDFKDINNLYIISDTHFGVMSDNIEWQHNMIDYFDNFFIPKLLEGKDDHTGVAILGDLFDNRNSINISTMNICADIVRKIAEICPVTILTGNHDMFKRHDSSLSSLTIVSNIYNVTVISEPTEIIYMNGKKILWIPYSGDNKSETDMLRKSDADYAFLHTECMGFVFDNNRQIVDGTNVNLFHGKRVFSGHIHKRQEAGRYIYVGTPYHFRRSDIGNIKGIYKLYIETDKLVFIPNLYSPQFKRIPVEKVLDCPKEDFMEYISNSYVDILVSKDRSTEVNISDIIGLFSPDEMIEKGYIPYRNIASYIYNSGTELYIAEENNKEVFTGSVEDYILMYLEKNIVDAGMDNGEKKEILELNNRLLNTAKEI